MFLDLLDGVREGGLSREDKEEKEGIPIPPTKPKIWSMAELAVCKTPPPGSAPLWPTLQGGGGFLDPSLVRQGSASSSAALRSSMFEMNGGGYAGMESKHGGGVGRSGDLPTDTPPQTPPNTLKMAALSHQNNVITGLNAQSSFQSLYHSHYSAPVNQHSYSGAGHSYQDNTGMGEECYNS